MRGLVVLAVALIAPAVMGATRVAGSLDGGLQIPSTFTPPASAARTTRNWLTSDVSVSLRLVVWKTTDTTEDSGDHEFTKIQRTVVYQPWTDDHVFHRKEIRQKAGKTRETKISGDAFRFDPTRANFQEVGGSYRADFWIGVQALNPDSVRLPTRAPWRPRGHLSSGRTVVVEVVVDAIELTPGPLLRISTGESFKKEELLALTVRNHPGFGRTAWDVHYICRVGRPFEAQGVSLQLPTPRGRFQPARMPPGAFGGGQIWVPDQVRVFEPIQPQP